MSHEVIKKKVLVNSHSPFYIVKFAFISNLNLKCMLRNSGITTIYIGLCILLFILTVKATQRLMSEIIFIMRVNVMYNVWCEILHITWDLVGMVFLWTLQNFYEYFFLQDTSGGCFCYTSIWMNYAVFCHCILFYTHTVSVLIFCFKASFENRSDYYFTSIC